MLFHCCGCLKTVILLNEVIFIEHENGVGLEVGKDGCGSIYLVPLFLHMKNPWFCLFSSGNILLQSIGGSSNRF